MKVFSNRKFGSPIFMLAYHSFFFKAKQFHNMELIKITHSEIGKAVSMRELYEFLEIQTPFKDWSKRMLEYDFIENQDFNLHIFEQVRFEGNREVKREIQDYALTIDTAKEISMIQRTAKGKEARRYFIEVEKAYQSQSPKSQIENLTRKDLALWLVEAENEKERLQLEVQTLAPKAEIYERLMSSDELLTMAETAKVLSQKKGKTIGQNRLFAFLKEKRVLKSDNVPYQSYIDSGYFKLIVSTWTDPENNKERMNFKTNCTVRGLEWLSKMSII